MLSTKEAANIIESTVTMRMVLAAYGIDPGRQGRQFTRIQCPIHRGHDKNFSYDDNRYKCFVCLSKGGVIKFVSAYTGLPWREAVDDINNRLNLGIPIDVPAAKRDVNPARRKGVFRIEVAKATKRVLDGLNRDFGMAYDKYLPLEKEELESGIASPEAEKAYEKVRTATENIFYWRNHEMDDLSDYADMLEELEISESAKIELFKKGCSSITKAQREGGERHGKT